MASSAIERQHCAHCDALLAPTDRFCVVCGTPRSEVRRGQSKQRGVIVLIGASIFLLIVVVAVALVYFNAPERRGNPAVSQIDQPAGLAILPGATGRVYAISGGKLLASDDQGTSWQSIRLDGDVAAVTAALDGSRIYLAGSRWWMADGNGLREFSSNLPAASVRALAVDPADPNHLYAAAEGQGLLASTDAGAHWAIIGPNLPAGFTSLVVGPGQLFFAATDGHGIFASADGREWSNANGFVNGALPTSTIRAITFDPNSGDRYVSPTGETQTGALFVGTDRGIYKSIDSGVSWSSQTFHQPIAALAVDPSGTRRMIVVGTDGNVYRIP